MRKITCITGILLSLALTSVSHGTSVVINEFLASNATVLADEEGDYGDWIELYNTSTSPVSLNGYTLSDDSSVPDRWILPDISIAPHGFLLIHASGKDRTDLTHYWDQDRAAHWKTIITQGDSWRYRAPSAAPPSDWRTIGFDDASWWKGPSGLGYGDGDDATPVPPYIIVFYIRKTFTLDEVDEITHLLLHVDYDDAFVAYVNDVEIARANVGVVGVPPVYRRTARAAREAQIYQGGVPEPYLVENTPSILRPGENVLAIQVHNVDASSTDLSIIPFLTLGMASPPAGAPREVPPLLQPHVTLHTSFRLDRDGEFIGLYDPSGAVVDSLTFDEQVEDISFGRQPEGGAFEYYFSEPTPNAPNSTAGVSQIVFTPPPAFSEAPGFYTNPVRLTVRAPSSDAEVHYTLDGSEPTDSSPTYRAPITIDKTAVVRARTFRPDFLPSSIVTRTYFINEPFSLSVVSLTTDPPNLWDEERGIYAFGKEYEPNFPHFGANFWEDWECPVHMEYFEPDGSLGFSLDAGMKIHGGWSRGYEQKSLRIHCRGGYGQREIAYRIFDDKPIDRFRRIVLRNSGNDWGWKPTMFRDALMHELIRDTDVDRMAYRPAIVLLNGEFWGIHNIRERVDKYYLQSNRGVDPENLDILENQSNITANVIEGDPDHYNAMIDYIKGHPLNVRSHFEHIQTQMDTDNFITYCIFQIYGGNADWPGNNIKYWRPRTPEGRWKWLLFDTDFCFGVSSSLGHNTLASATQEDGPGWPNPDWSTFLLRSLLENEAFRTDFINRFADLLNSTLLPERVEALIDRVKTAIEPEMPRHKRKWGGSMNDWYNQVEAMKRFADKRAFYVRNHILTKFGLPGTAFVTLDASPRDGGRIQINTLTIEALPWTGTYFKGAPVELTAIPQPGYVFDGWSDPSSSGTPTIEVDLAQNYSVTATFEPDPSVTAIPQEPRASAPMTFNLKQNYPNPFNASTTIRYTIGALEREDEADVEIKIYNISGQWIDTLTIRRQGTGEHRVTWDGSDFPSGVYLYRFVVGNVSLVDEMLLLK